MLLALWAMDLRLQLLRPGFLQEPQQKLLEGRLLEGELPEEKLIARKLVALLLQWE